MTDHRVTDLTYGHLGEAVYDQESRQWFFNRQPGRRNVLRPVGPVTELVPRSNRPIAQVERRPRNYTRQEARDLAHTHPELVPAFSLLRPEASTSEAILYLTENNEPTFAERVALGKAQDQDNRRPVARSVNVLAIAAGQAGEAVRLFRIQGKGRQRGSRHGAVPTIPQITNEDTWWYGSGAPVCQISFAQSGGEGYNWMAIRQPTLTTICRPLYHREPAIYFPAPGVHHQRASRLDVNPLLSIPITRTGGVPHADVAFNPWNHHQLAVVDQGGQWSVWDIQGGKQRRNGYKAERRVKGWISAEYRTLDAQNGPSIQTDGWGCISWAGSVRTLLVCNRTHVATFDVASYQAIQHRSAALELARTSSWILDVKRCPTNDAQFFVLTSNQIFWLVVAESGDAKEGDTTASAGANVLLSWRHFRHSEDISMHMAVTMVGSVATVLVYSRLNSLVTVHQFSTTLGGSLPTSVSDPFRLLLPSELLQPTSPIGSSSRASAPRTIAGLLFQKLEYAVQEESENENDSSSTHSPPIFRALLLCNDLSLRQCFYTDHDSDTYGPRDLDFLTTAGRQHTGTGKSSQRINADDFVVEDGAESESSESSVTGTAARTRTGVAPKELRKHTHALDWHWMYELAFGKLQLETAEARRMKRLLDAGLSMETDPVAYIQAMDGKLQETLDKGFRPIQTLHELQGQNCHVMDIDAVFSALQVTLDSFVRRSPEADGAALPLARFLTSSSFFGLPEATGGQALIEGTSFPSLTEIYDRLIEEWLVPLPKAAPDKYRVTTERMIRIITIGLYLASIGVQLRISTSAEPAIPLSFTRAGPSRGEEIQLSVRTRSGAKDKGKERETEAKSPGGSAPLPPLGTAVRGADDGDRHGQGPSSDPMSSLPTPGATPPAGSHASAAGSEAGEIEEDPASVRLRAYTSLNPQPQLAKPMRKILSGWVDGGDPSNYTWKPLHAPDRDGSDDEDDDGDDAASSSLSVAEQRRRRRRWQKRLRREQQLQQSQSQSVASGSASTLPPLLAFKPWGSQPVRSSTNLNPNGGSSSQAFKEGNTREEQLPMTQAEPGTFGSRQAVTVKGQEQRKKRRRAAGF